MFAVYFFRFPGIFPSYEISSGLYIGVVCNILLLIFRFYGRIAEHPDAHDGPTLEAMRQNASGLDRISGERIWAELSKILEGNFGGELMAKMLSLGMGPHMGRFF